MARLRNSATLRWAAIAVLVTGPWVLAFWSGGFFDRPRQVAAVVAWALVVVAFAVSRRRLPRDRWARLALLGLVLLTAWTALSLDWTSARDAAEDDLQRLVLYAGALVAAAALLRGATAVRALEAVALLGTVALVLYGMGDRLLPHIVFIEHFFTSGSRLDQPLTYWNAMGLVAATGLLLSARLAGDRTRPDPVRVLAVAAAAPLGVGLYLSFSRGAMAALGAGLVVLLAVAPTWSQLRATGISLQAAILPAAAASLMPAVVNFDATEAQRDQQAVILNVILVLTMVGAGALQAWAGRAERAGATRMGRLPLPRRTGWLAAGAVLLAAGAFVAAAAKDQRAVTLPSGASSQRLGSVQSNRYQYWKVAAQTFADHPLKGAGSASFRVEWLDRRTIPEQAKDAHSLYLETAAELGLVGLAALALFLAGIAGAARRALRAEPELAAGAVGAIVVYAFHAGIDWHWEMPAVTLVALLFAGALLALSDGG